MKKFTKIDEDLLKESTEASMKLDMYYKKSIKKLDLIKKELDNMMEDFKDSKNNWGYVGNMTHVDEELDNILEFLGVKEMIDDSNKYNL
jgi:hypothetical protein